MITFRRSTERGAWLRVVRGHVPSGDMVLTTGEGAEVTVERAASLAACRRPEVLLIDIVGLQPGLPARGANLGGRSGAAG